MLGEAEGEMRPLGTSALMVVEPKSGRASEMRREARLLALCSACKRVGL